MKKYPLLVTALVALAALVLVSALAGPAASLTAEDFERLGLEAANDTFEAPEFRLATLKGGETSLSEHRGEVVVLNFWTTW